MNKVALLIATALPFAHNNPLTHNAHFTDLGQHGKFRGAKYSARSPKALGVKRGKGRRRR